MESSVSSEKNHVNKASKTVGEVSEETVATFKQIISTLPQEHGWKNPEPLSLYEGVWCFPSFHEAAIFARQNFRAQPNDIFVCGHPKAGNVWLKALTFAIVTRAQFDLSENPLLTKAPHDCIPPLEIMFMKNRTLPEPADNHRFWATHVQYSFLPKSVIDSGCKIVYICRDPMDMIISIWHFMRKVKAKTPELIISVEEVYELFCKGTSFFGPYWDHVLGYWKASLEFPDRVLFLKYEEMIEDTVFHLKRLANFLGYPFSAEEEREGEVEKIAELCSFEHLSNLEVNKSGCLHSYKDFAPINCNVFFRKGKVGDWRNHLTSEMAERLVKIMEKELSGSGLTFRSLD